MNGTHSTRGARVLTGIRQLAWEELPPERRERAARVIAAAPDGDSPWERYLAAEVRRRAEAYRRTMGDALLTPRALAKWWGRVGGEMPQRKRGLSPSEVLEVARSLSR